MIGAREDIALALFNLLSTTPGFASYWRKFPPMDQISNMQKPALLMRAKPGMTEKVNANYGMPANYHMVFELCLVIQTPSAISDYIPATTINPLIDAVEAQLAPIAGAQTQNLGLSNVSRVWIEGNIDVIEAISGDVSFVYIPVNIVAV